MTTPERGPLRRLGAIIGIGALALIGVALGPGAASAADGPNLDEDRTGSLTIHKLESPTTDPDLPNDGSEVDTSGLTPLAGVEFTVTRVTDIDLTTNAGWEEAEALAEAVANGEGLGAHTTSVVGTRTTSSPDGTTAFADLPLGVYYVEETSAGDNPIVAPAVPFLVTIPVPTTIDDSPQWLYDVHVYPKNAMGETQKTIDDSDAVGLGDVVSFSIAASVPSFYGTEELTSFIVTDALDERLGFVAGSAVVTAQDEGGAAVALDSGAYTITEPAAATGGTLTITFTDPAGLDALRAIPGGTVSVAFDTTVESIGDGTITNDAQTFINDTEVTSNTVETLWGAVKIFKYDSATDEGLEGAVFSVFSAETGGEPISVDGATRFTSGADGYVTIDGLKAGTYYLEEIEAPERYLPTEGRIEFTVTPGSIAEAVLVSVSNQPIPDAELPLTGGGGTAAFTALGLGLAMAAVGTGLVVARRRARH